ncbi:hypothetical protein [Nocardia sp. NPDC002869]|uniref:hypothetical protein n=1 Tax=Nocardia sp. NPDC002869 TaxID=3161032 RepID=UPI00398D0E60
MLEPKGGRFTSTVLRHYADAGRIDPGLLTPVVVDIGETLVLKFSLDSGELPGDRILADTVDVGPPTATVASFVMVQP